MWLRWLATPFMFLAVSSATSVLSFFPKNREYHHLKIGIVMNPTLSTSRSCWASSDFLRQAVSWLHPSGLVPAQAWVEVGGFLWLHKSLQHNHSPSFWTRQLSFSEKRSIINMLTKLQAIPISDHRKRERDSPWGESSALQNVWFFFFFFKFLTLYFVPERIQRETHQASDHSFAR